MAPRDPDQRPRDIGEPGENLADDEEDIDDDTKAALLLPLLVREFSCIISSVSLSIFTVLSCAEEGLVCTIITHRHDIVNNMITNAEGILEYRNIL